MVSYEGKDKEGKPVKATLSALAAQQPKRCHKERNRISNDQYWLLLPFHFVWDGPTATDEGQQKRPTGDASAQRVVMKYPSEGGYQPGDTWELYVGADKRIEEIVYHRGAANPPHPRERNLCGLQEGWPTPDFNGSPGDGGRKTLPDYHYGCVG
jgi:hypothetical protein